MTAVSGRANASVPPPAGNGTMKVTGRAGQAPCARASRKVIGASAAPAAACRARRRSRRKGGAGSGHEELRRGFAQILAARPVASIGPSEGCGWHPDCRNRRSQATGRSPMPQARWTEKRERQYKHIKDSLLEQRQGREDGRGDRRAHGQQGPRPARRERDREPDLARGHLAGAARRLALAPRRRRPHLRAAVRGGGEGERQGPLEDDQGRARARRRPLRPANARRAPHPSRVSPTARASGPSIDWPHAGCRTLALADRRARRGRARRLVRGVGERRRIGAGRRPGARRGPAPAPPAARRAARQRGRRRSVSRRWRSPAAAPTTSRSGATRPPPRSSSGARRSIASATRRSATSSSACPASRSRAGRGAAARSACAAWAAATPRSCSTASGCRPASRSIR